MSTATNSVPSLQAIAQDSTTRSAAMFCNYFRSDFTLKIPFYNNRNVTSGECFTPFLILYLLWLLKHVTKYAFIFSLLRFNCMTILIFFFSSLFRHVCAKDNTYFHILIDVSIFIFYKYIYFSNFFRSIMFWIYRNFTIFAAYENTLDDALMGKHVCCINNSQSMKHLLFIQQKSR